MSACPTLPVMICLARIVSQGLVPATSATSVVQAVSNLLAVQGQQVSALPHALLERTPSAKFSDVSTAFNQLELVRSRPMRGTVHITSAADYHWLRLTLNQRSTYSLRNQLVLGGISETDLETAWQLVKTHAGEQGIRRKDMFALWVLSGLAVKAQNATSPQAPPTEQARVNRWCTLMMWELDRNGLVVEGPMGTNEHRFIDATCLPAATSAASGYKFDPTNLRAARMEVARRYAYGHGPVSVADLARWTALPVTQARQALEDAASDSSDIKQIIRVKIEKNTFTPAAPPKAVKEYNQLLYMRADLPDLLTDNLSQARRLIYLPAFDELHVGYRNRTCLTDEAGEKLICPNANGLFRPLIVNNGRLIAVRPASGEVIWLDKPSAYMDKRVN
ncbi:MAG: winged helix DNA-binding domain-containing protein, partial [Actinomyces graevenitzii]|nr:winged helix DNA-binding domain-containing protein [Actinomyces graevenitzii]